MDVDDQPWSVVGARLLAVANEAAGDADVPADLLGRYLELLADATLSGRGPTRAELDGVRSLGRRAAERGVDANQAVDLYLSAARGLWREIVQVLPSDGERVTEAAGTLLGVMNEAVGALVEGHQDARRQSMRREESARREFVDDLLRGDADVARLVERAEPFGVDLTREHQVVLAAPASTAGHLERAAIVMERFIVDQLGDREVLIATKDELLVMIVPGALRNAITGAKIDDAGGYLQPELGRRVSATTWQVAGGRPFAGAYGVARSYEEARESLLLARRLRMQEPVVPLRDLLAYRVLGRDQTALVDLVHGLLLPLTGARGGAKPLLLTLEAFFATGAITTATARRLHVSARTVTYRLGNVARLTGQDPADPGHRLALQMAVLGARLLGWPETELPARPPR